MPEETAPVIVDPQGRPARRDVDRRCPQCGAGPERRTKSAGFGMPHDVCRQCGHEFKELTCG